MKRREFIAAGVVGVAGAMAGGCSGSKESTPAPAIAPLPKFRAIARFGGLFGVVTSPTFDRAEVLFVNGPKVAFPKHVAVLKAHLDNVSGAAPNRLDDYDPSIGVWDVKQSQVTFGVAGTLQRAPASGAPCPISAADWRDAAWIANLSTVLGTGKGQVNPALVQTGDLSATIVDTRIVLSAGILGASLPTDFKARRMKFAMLGAPTLPARPVSDVVELDMADIQALTITIAPYAGTGSTTLTFSAPSSGRPLYFWFENHTDPAATPMADHFRALYELLQPPGTTIRPFPGNAVECALPGPPRDFPNYCPPAMLEY